jgi:hypothetical protein
LLTEAFPCWISVSQWRREPIPLGEEFLETDEHYSGGLGPEHTLAILALLLRTSMRSKRFMTLRFAWMVLAPLRLRCCDIGETYCLLACLSFSIFCFASASNSGFLPEARYFSKPFIASAGWVPS